MSINLQVNLLPEIKQQYIKAQSQRRLVISISIIVSAIAVVLLISLLAIDLSQKKHLRDLNRDITNETSTLKNEPNINKILTVQNQLRSLTALHAGEPAAQRLFTTYLNEVTPAKVSIDNLNISFTQYTAILTGTADSLSSINQYVDTLKTTTYKSSAVKTPTNAFSNVVLSTFGISGSTSTPNQAASYTINLSYDKNIFDITQQDITLSVPPITTRADVSQSPDLFIAAPVTTKSSSAGGH